MINRFLDKLFPSVGLADVYAECARRGDARRQFEAAYRRQEAARITEWTSASARRTEARQTWARYRARRRAR